MKTFNFCSFKGGTAKTSTCLHLASCLATHQNQRVLLIDFDSQANLSIGIGIGPDSLKTMVPVLQGQEPLLNVIHPTEIENLHIVASNTYLDGIERTHPLASDPYSHEYLRRALEDLKDSYDLCFIDTPPSLGWLTQSAFYASDYTMICAIPEAYSILGLRRLKAFIQMIKKYHPVDIFGVVLSLWNENGSSNDKFLNMIESSFPSKIFYSKIRRDIAISKSALEGKTVFEFEKNSRAAQDYLALTEEFMKRYHNQTLHELMDSL